MNKTERSIKKLGDLLNINDDDLFTEGDETNTEKKNRKKSNNRYFKTLKKELKQLAKCSDKDYVKTIMKKMVERGMVVIEMLEQEMRKDVFARDAEVAGQLINNVTSIVEKINSLNIAEKKMELEERKVVVAEQKLLPQNNQPQLPGGTNIQNNIVAVGTMADVVKLLQDHGDNIPEIPVEDIRDTE